MKLSVHNHCGEELGSVEVTEKGPVPGIPILIYGVGAYVEFGEIHFILSRPVQLSPNDTLDLPAIHYRVSK